MALDPYFDKVALLCSFDGTEGSTNIIDTKGHPLTANAPAVISTAQSKFGGSSLYLNGGGGFISGVPTPDNNVTNTTDIAIQCWLYLTSSPFSTGGRVIGCGGSGAQSNWALTIESGSRRIQLEWGNSAGFYEFRFWNGSLARDQWNFVKVSITGNIGQAWLNGGSVGTYNVSGTSRVPQPGDYIRIGKAHNNTLPFIGYIEELRVTIGYARTGENGGKGEPYPTQGPPFIIGNIPLTLVPKAFSGAFYSISGSVPLKLVPSGFSVNFVFKSIKGAINTRLSTFANMVNVTHINPHWIARHYTCRMTGETDLQLTISSFSATIKSSRQSSLSVTVHGDNDLIDKISSRANSDIIISRVYIYSDGSYTNQDFIRVNYNALSSSISPQNGSIINLIGTRVIKVYSSKTVQLSDAISRTLSDDVLTYRSSINDNVSLGDLAIINDDQFIVGAISYLVNADNEYMQITEYKPDGKEIGFYIGNNASLIDLIEHNIFNTHENYLLWRGNARFYGGFSSDSFNYDSPYPLYRDTLGFLWYLPGFEGSSNIPVMLSNGITQATVIEASFNIKTQNSLFSGSANV